MNALVFALIGIVLFVGTFVIIDKLTPFHLWKEIVDDKNVALAIQLVAMSIGLCIIIAAAVHKVPVILFLSVFLIAACGLIYELIAGTLASYLLGDSVLHISTVIGAYLFAMGVGSFLSRFLGRGLVARFVSIELMVGLVGGFSSSALFLAFAYTQSFRVALYFVVIVVGTLVGLEIPLLMRILEGPVSLRRAGIARIDVRLSGGAGRVDPVSARAGAEAGNGAIGVAVRNHEHGGGALWSDSSLFSRDQIGAYFGSVARRGAAALLLLGGGMVGAERISAAADNNLYADEVILARETRDISESC